jgi:hypothetical protein
MTRERLLFVVALAVWLACALIALVCSPPLGHDEAQYAVQARGIAVPWLYLSSGTIWIARVGVALGGADWALRILPVLLGAGVVIATWFVGRTAFSERVGAWSAAVIAGAHPFILRNAELLSDLPAAACILTGIAILVRELEGEVRWRIVIVAPAFAGAFYIRYGSVPVIAIIGATALGLWWRPILKRPAPIVATVILFAALLVPHGIDSLQSTGSVLGVLQIGADAPGHYHGLVTYLTSNPFMFYGFLVAPLMLVGLAGVVRPPARWRPTVFLGVIAVGQILFLGYQAGAQSRYVYVASVLLVVLGIDALVRVTGARTSRAWTIARRAALPIVVLSWIGAAIGVVAMSRHLTRARAPLEVAGDVIRDDAAGRPCVFTAIQTPHIMWKTKCDSLSPSDSLVWPADRRRYVVSFAGHVVDVKAIAPDAHPIALAIPPGVEHTEVWYLP